MTSSSQKIDFKTLNVWQSQVFAAALLQRMLPNYRYFSEAVNFGDYKVLENQLDLLWQKLSGLPLKINFEAQHEKRLPHIPASQDFEIYAVNPALDFCTGLELLFESFEENNPRIAAEISRLSKACVAGYIEFISEQQQTNSDDLHPLVEWENETQFELYQQVLTVANNREGCQIIKEAAIGERLSSLAIEY